MVRGFRTVSFLNSRPITYYLHLTPTKYSLKLQKIKRAVKGHKFEYNSTFENIFGVLPKILDCNQTIFILWWVAVQGFTNSSKSEYKIQIET